MVGVKIFKNNKVFIFKSILKIGITLIYRSYINATYGRDKKY